MKMKGFVNGIPRTVTHARFMILLKTLLKLYSALDIAHTLFSHRMMKGPKCQQNFLWGIWVVRRICLGSLF